jgi:hypothetical protein
MGLDQYLSGKKYYWTNWENKEANIFEDGFRLKEQTYQIGYWRKHPDLHGFIIENFAEGVDECQEIELWDDAVKEIITAVKENKLPKTKGFFFGESDGSEAEETIKIFEKALDWKSKAEKGVSRSIVYRGSW